MEKHNLYIVVFGVAGSGKTLIGKMLAQKLKIAFIEGDDYHTKSNIEKMENGHPLTDADRMPWLHILKTKIAEMIASHQSFVLSCSALKISYRNILREAGDIRFLFLDVPEEIVTERLEKRKGHFMPPSLLHSQIETLERPQNAEGDIIRINAMQLPKQIVENILLEIK